MNMLAFGIDEVLKIPVSDTCDWDFNYAIGDTIKEKYQTLFDIVSKLSKSDGLAVVVTSPRIGDLLPCFTDMDNIVPVYKDINERSKYIGEVNGFHLYENKTLTNEIRIFVNGKCNRICLSNIMHVLGTNANTN